MDIKCPDSNMVDKNLWSNLDHLKKTDEVKFVIASRKDFEWAIECIKINKLEEKCDLLMSVAFWSFERRGSCRMDLRIFDEDPS